jgi:hypothetical protein
MKSLIFYSPTRFNSLSDQEDVRIWLTLFKVFSSGISFVDRTGTIQLPIRTSTPAQVCLPAPNPAFNSSFDECAVKRAEEIYQKHLALGVPIRLQWSGGIDSTSALVAFIELLGVDRAKKSLEIVMTSDSIVENPFVWEELIRKENFKIINTLQFTEQWNGSAIMVNGEGGDQIHGVDLYRILIQQHGEHALTMLWTPDLISSFIKFKAKVSDYDAERLAAVLIDQVKRAPIDINTMGDFWWWINFTCKWAATFYRIVTKSKHPIDAEFIDNYFFPFYASNDFQLWSMYKREEKHQGTWATYKWKAKDFVCDFLKNNDYQNKHRQSSLYLVMCHASRAEAIDNEFNYYNSIVPEEWYNPDNSFRI